METNKKDKYNKIVITVKIEKEKINELLEYYSQFKDENIKGEYILSAFYKNETKIVVYTNNSKSYYKTTFSGKNEINEASKFNKIEELIISKKEKSKESNHYVDINEQIGSDEVGAGDLLFPLIVVATYVDKNTYKLIKNYDIKDSKKMGDKKILEVVPLILKHIKASKLTLQNDKYNELIEKDNYNMVSIKCMLHNAALKNLETVYHNANIYIDEFVNPKKYYKYLENEQYVVSNINFKNKGETYYPSVALSSCVARYYLLKEKEKLDQKYNLDFPFGAGKKVDDFLLKFFNIYGIEEVKKITKRNFKNYDRLIKK